MSSGNPTTAHRATAADPEAIANLQATGVAAAAGQGNREPPAPLQPIAVRSVAGRRELDTFIRLPWKLYRDAPKWVPPLIAERRKHLSPRHNPFFRHGEAEYFIAWRGADAVGRISAHVDHRLNEFQDNDWGLFGFFECVDDAEVAEMLFDAAEEWLRMRARDRMVGPLDFSTNHECGLLVDGYELMPQVLENWHHPYYRTLFEQSGMSKAIDLYKWQILNADHDRVLPAIYELADSLYRDHGIRVRRMRRRDFSAEVQRFMDVYNAAWESNWGFVPLTNAELEAYAKALKPILDERLAFIAELDGTVVGAALTLPDLNKVLARLHGRLLPLGWLRFLRERRRLDEIRVFALGVKEEYRHTGTAAAFYAEHWRECLRRPIKRAETGWILETNDPMNRAMEALGGDIVKRYRIYERPVEAGPTVSPSLGYEG